MIEWLSLSEDERLISIQQAANKSGMSTKVIEKDWWVTLVLKVLFQSEFAPYLSFKGGTSLSKGWNLIARFSEDIDIAVERKLLGFEEDLSKSAVKKLKRVACEFTSTILKSTLEKELAKLDLSNCPVIIIANKVNPELPDTDPQTLRIIYRSILDPVPYIADSVKLEVSARSFREPAVERKISSLLGQFMPGFLWTGESFPVPTVEPKRTFLEKIFLLHEEFLRPVDQIVYERMSRHLYDLERMIDTEHSDAALADNAYYDAIIKHRRNIIFKSGVNYNTHQRTTLNFIPPAEVLPAFERDYKLMCEQMIYDDNIKDFKTIITNLTLLLDRIKSIKV